MAEAKSKGHETAIAVSKAIRTHDEGALAATMCCLNPEEMRSVVNCYKGEFLRDLSVDLGNEVKDKLLKFILTSASTNLVDLDASLIREGVRGLGTNEHLLTEVLCTRSPEHLAHVKARYSSLYARHMLEDIKDDTSGHLRTVYVELLTHPRDRVGDVDEDVETLFKAGEDKWGTDEAKFIDIICHSTRAHCEAIYHAYAAKHKKALDYIIHDEMAGVASLPSTSHAGRALALLVTPLPLVFGNKFVKYLRPFSPKHFPDLARIIVTQRGLHLKKAAEHFQSVANLTLTEAISQADGSQPAAQLALTTMLKVEGC